MLFMSNTYIYTKLRKKWHIIILFIENIISDPVHFIKHSAVVVILYFDVIFTLC